jgi:DNA repair photolyase
MRRFTGHKEKWGEFVDVKVNVSDLLATEIKKKRIRALDVLHSRGIQTFVMIAPILPGSDGLIAELPGKVDHILTDRLNYSYANRIYLDNKMGWAKEDSFFIQKAEELRERFIRRNIPVQVLF